MLETVASRHTRAIKAGRHPLQRVITRPRPKFTVLPKGYDVVLARLMTRSAADRTIGRVRSSYVRKLGWLSAKNVASRLSRVPVE
jgi:hypothetical protein